MLNFLVTILAYQILFLNYSSSRRFSWSRRYRDIKLYVKKLKKLAWWYIFFIFFLVEATQYRLQCLYQCDHKTQGHLWGGVWSKNQATFIGLDPKKELCLVKKSQNFFLCTAICSSGWPLKIGQKPGLHAKIGLYRPSRSRVIDFWKLVVFPKNGYFSKFWWFFTAKLGHSAANGARY